MHISHVSGPAVRVCKQLTRAVHVVTLRARPLYTFQPLLCACLMLPTCLGVRHLCRSVSHVLSTRKFAKTPSRRTVHTKMLNFQFIFNEFGDCVQYKSPKISSTGNSVKRRPHRSTLIGPSTPKNSRPTRNYHSVLFCFICRSWLERRHWLRPGRLLWSASSGRGCVADI